MTGYRPKSDNPEAERMMSKEGYHIPIPDGEAGIPGKYQTEPWKSSVPWCYVCRQGLGDEHDPTDPTCIEGSHEPRD